MKTLYKIIRYFFDDLSKYIWVDEYGNIAYVEYSYWPYLFGTPTVSYFYVKEIDIKGESLPNLRLLNRFKFIKNMNVISENNLK